MIFLNIYYLLYPGNLDDCDQIERTLTFPKKLCILKEKQTIKVNSEKIFNNYYPLIY